MTAINGTKPAPTRDEIKQRRRRVREQLELHKLEQMESILWDGFGGSDLWYSLRERYGDPADGTGWVPIANIGDRKKGQKWPLWNNEKDLGELRQKSRIVCDSNASAQCLMNNLLNHIVGKGFTYKCQPKAGLDQSPEPGVQAGAGADAVVAATQAFVDKFLAVNRWTATIPPSLLTQAGIGTRERETVRRTFRDGEGFLRLFRSDGGMTYIRFVEPEQVTNDGGRSLRAEEGWSFGIKHAMEPFEDEERIEAYHVAYKSIDHGKGSDGEEVPADEMIHVKLPDEDAAIKRGTPAFSFDMLDALVRASKLQRNLSVSSAIQAATAEMWKHATGTQAQISSIAQGLGERQFTNPVTGKPENTERIRPGSIRRIPAGQEPVPLNWGTGSKTEFTAVVQADKRDASSAVNAPEHFTGDASNANYSSTKEAGTPWVIASEVIQTHFGFVFAFVVWRAIAYAVECNQLPQEALAVVELQVEPTAVPPTDPLQAAQENQIYTSIKVKSRQTVQMELGLDPDHEDANIEEDEQKFGMGAMGNPLAALMGGDDDGGVGGGVNNPRMPAKPIAAMESEWDEEKHPRADDGKFGHGGGGAAATDSSKQSAASSHGVSGIADRIEEAVSSAKGRKEMAVNLKAIKADAVARIKEHSAAAINKMRAGGFDDYPENIRGALGAAVATHAKDWARDLIGDVNHEVSYTISQLSGGQSRAEIQEVIGSAKEALGSEGLSEKFEFNAKYMKADLADVLKRAGHSEEEANRAAHDIAAKVGAHLGIK